MGLGQSVALEQCSLRPPAAPTPPNFSISSCCLLGPLVEDPEEESCQLSLVLAPGIPKHVLWARLWLSASGGGEGGAALQWHSLTMN